MFFPWERGQLVRPGRTSCPRSQDEENRMAHHAVYRIEVVPRLEMGRQTAVPTSRPRTNWATPSCKIATSPASTSCKAT
ncbi:MAG: hypothetical protein M5U34_21110 [Chloroflexi bacterium]|nr:hypothetical protein [Chloroflexota bacterium]